MSFLDKLLIFVPRPLPVGMTQFENWSNRIITLTGPLADRDSMKFALASQIMHLGAQKSNIPDSFFVSSMKKAAANQVASQVFQDIKVKQREAAEAAQAAYDAKLAEATANAQDEQQVATNEPQS